MYSRRTFLYLAGATSVARGASGVRPAAVAGQFYPLEPSNLRGEVDRLLEGARKGAATVGLRALVVPHAGYPYSGQIAAEAYGMLRGLRVRRVILIGPTHVEPFAFNSVFDGTHYETPLGRVAVDQEFAKRLGRSKGCRLSPAGHLRTGERGEHSLEVQLPFLQRVLEGGFSIVPVVMGEQNYGQCRALAVALARLAREDPATLMIASSDLSHYHPYADAVALDRRVVNAVTEWDYHALSMNLDAGIWEACGGGPMIAVMMAAERMGAARAELLKYANSGDVTTERTRVVGYCGFAIREGQPVSPAAVPLNGEERSEVLSIARRAVDMAVREGKAPVLASPGLRALLQDRGVFVTLKKKGTMRGCVGNTSASRPLYAAVRDVAALAAVRDPRFKPVAVAELPEIEVEVSVLSRLRRAADSAEVRVGEHGLALRRGGREGLLLPQVAVEEKWDRLGFLNAVAEKAGLPPDAWSHPESDLFLFTAQVFS